MDDFLRGVLIGLTVAVPVGPMAILVIRKSLFWGWPAGLAFGAGIALADTTYATVATGGFATIESLLEDNQSLIRLVGGLLLLLIGGLIARSNLEQEIDLAPAASRTQMRRDLVGGYLLALSNPATILIFMAMLAGYGASFTQELSDIPILVAGVFAGSAGWWALMAVTTSRIRSRLTITWIRRVNIVAGLVIGCFGVLAVVSSR